MGTAACASTPASGPLTEGWTTTPRITAVDTAHPPSSAWIQLDQPSYAVLLLVVPSHSATVLYPADSSVDNHLSAGAHQVTFRVPGALALSDTIRAPRGRDTTIVYPGGVDPNRRTARSSGPMTVQPPAFLLLVTSPHPLVFSRIVQKTAGVSIPSMEMEALNAVAKTVKNTIVTEPREWSGYYQQVDVNPRR
ncbi:MAG TPA: hypothetical protein VJ867_05740 [Gemmatimonadaceae bacterium]|nr:hypothetical protein [Gemmatimonadaceae bacterium]